MMKDIIAERIKENVIGNQERHQKTIRIGVDQTEIADQ